MRNEGITILQIIITIIVMIIIMAVVILYGQGVSKEARIAAIYNEIREIESSLKEAKLLNEMKFDGEYLNLFGEINLNETDSRGLGSPANTYYYLDFTTSKRLENVLGLENVDNDYILDYENLNIFLIEGLETANGDIKYDSDEIVDYYNKTFVK